MQRTSVVLGLLLVGMLVADLAGREWTSSNGKFKIEAEFVAVKKGKVVLEKPDGSYFSVPVEKLSEEDRAFIESETGEALESPVQESATAGDSDAEAPGVRVVKLKGEKVDDSPGEARRFSDLRWGVSSLAFSPDGGFLAAGKMDRALMLFDVSNSSRTAFIKDLRLLAQITACAFTPDGKQLLTGGSTGLIQVWNVSKSGELETASQFVGHAKEIACISVSADGKFALSGGSEKRVRYWRIDNGKEVAAFDGFKGTVKCCQISRAGDSAWATDGEKLLSINLKAEMVKKKSELAKSWALGQFAAFSADGRMVAVGELYNVRLWDMKAGQELAPFVDSEIQYSGDFTPDGTRLVTGGSCKVNVWDVKTQKRIGVLATEGRTYVQTLAVSPDNWHVAAILARPGNHYRSFAFRGSDRQDAATTGAPIIYELP